MASSRISPHTDMLLRTGTGHGMATPSGQLTCRSAEEPAYLKGGSILVYAKALAYHLTGNVQYAASARDGIEGLLGIISFGKPGNTKKPDRQCQLNVSWIPGFIRAADLIEDHPIWQKSGHEAEIRGLVASGRPLHRILHRRGGG